MRVVVFVAARASVLLHIRIANKANAWSLIVFACPDLV